MLNSNYLELNQLCQSNYHANQLCHQKQFWIDKFNHDYLPLDINLNTSELKREFMNLSKINTIIDKMFNIITINDQAIVKYVDITLTFYNDDYYTADFRPYLPKLLRDKINNINGKNRISLMYNVNKNTYYIHIKNTIIKSNINSTLDQCKNVMMSIMYHFPDVIKKCEFI